MRKELCAVIGLALCCLAASDVPQPEAVKPIENKRKLAMVDALRVYQQAVLVAERQCVNDYQQAARTAAKGGNIDLVAALVEGKKVADKRMEKAQFDVESQTAGIIISARWGIGDRMVDVTNKLRTMLSAGSVAISNQTLGDPAPFSVKRLLLTIRTATGRETLEIPEGRQLSLENGAIVQR